MTGNYPDSLCFPYSKKKKKRKDVEVSSEHSSDKLTKFQQVEIRIITVIKNCSWQDVLIIKPLYKETVSYPFCCSGTSKLTPPFPYHPNPLQKMYTANNMHEDQQP